MKELVEKLIANFNHDNLVVLFRNKTRSFKPINEELSCFNDDLFSECTLLGSFKTTDDELEMLVFTAKTNNDLSERSGKKRQYELGKRVLKEQLRYSGGFFVFYDSNGAFRFSFIYDIPLPNGKVSFSNFRRYTYFVCREQTNKTFIRQISGAEFTSLSKIIEAFSIEPVTKQFYNEIQNWYFWALQKVRFPQDAENQPNGREINLIRFITRIIFIYFMKEKKWISNNLFQQNELREILINLNSEESTYYKAILQNLFFAVLNTPIQERKFRREDTYKGRNDDYMNHTYFRYHKLFKNENDIIEIFQNIPFLNGGLFECLDKRKDDPDNNTGKEIRIDGFSDVESKQPIFPNELFFADEKEFILQNEDSNDKKNTKVNVRGIINILNSYNFTTEENSLTDTEIALDPELLGKVFENLLAAYNPETATTARKATGSYYTPREIVDFMVNESLKVYFQSSYVREFGNQSLRDFENKLETLFSLENDENPFDKQITQFLIEKIHKVKILDPAVGSGAFLMGCLHKLVFLLSKLDPHNNSWKNEQLRTVEMITDPDLRQKVKNKIEESFKKNELDYGRKLYLIQNCIYGVDIQPIAVQITKLRFFISLLVDEKINNTSPEENFGIDPLPNLETKLIAANTLINLPVEPYTCPRMNEITELEKKIFELRKNHFSTSSSDDKAKIQKQDFEYRKKLIQIIEMYVKENQDKLIELQNELLKYPPKIETVSKQTLLGNESVKVDVNKEKREYIQKKINETKKYVEADKLLTQKFIKIASFNIYNSNFPTDWFDPEWMFGVTGGFDIVIGNPPYVRQENIENKDLIIDSISKCFVGDGRSLIKINKRSDLYVYFYYKGLSLLKTSGVLCYISSNSWLDVGYGAKLQEFLLRYQKPLMIVDNLAERSFEADINTVIVFIEKPQTISWEDKIKFVVFKKAFREIIKPEILSQIHYTNEKTINDTFRLIPKTRKELWLEGIETEEDQINENRLWNYPYIGNKWGGKYLRAPEIFFKILEKGKDKLVRLGDIAENYYGIKTGANEFFYLMPVDKPCSKGLLYVKNSAGWEGLIEEEFLKPVIKSPRELNTILVKENDLRYKVFVCHKTKSELKGSCALEYIEWGEKQGYNKRPTCDSKQLWWDLIESKGNILCLANLNDRLTFFYNKNGVIFEHTLYGLLITKDVEKYIIILNSFLTSLILEIHGRISLGEGALGLMVYEYLQLPILNAKFLSLVFNFTNFSNFLARPIRSIFEELGFQKCNQKNCKHPEHPYEFVKPEEVSFDKIMPDRRELDKIVFEALGLTEDEQLEVYRAVLELVKNRLLKARSR